MSRHPLRRGQLVVPFGVGSMNTYPDGVSYMVAGLDHWYPPGADHGEFRVDEWRLSTRLGVDHFRLPPDFRPRYEARDKTAENLELKVPAVRFPRAHTCSSCGRLDMRPLTDSSTRIRCPECRERDRYGYFSQVQVIALCSVGHIQDFPWHEWVHRDVSPDCRKAVKIYSTGSGATLAGLWVECDCGKKRNLARVTGLASAPPEAEENVAEPSTVLTEQLSSSGRYTCAASRPWLGEGRRDVQLCGRPMRAGLRSAANTYFAEVVTSIFVPRTSGSVPAELLEKLRRPPASATLKTAAALGGEVGPEQLRKVHPGLFDAFEDQQIAAGLDELQGESSGSSPQRPPSPGEPEEQDEQAFRALELEALRTERDDVDLTIRQVPKDEYWGALGKLLRGVSLVDRLRVTRTFTGFSRIEPRPLHDQEVDAHMLWRDPPGWGGRWLPAALVFGEGILLDFSGPDIGQWANQPQVRSRVNGLMTRYRNNGGRPSIVVDDVSPTSVALHTLAHLLILELSFHSGYSATSLAERLYVGEGEDGVTASVLIYTAAGDTEGTMGGLVRLGRPGSFEPIFERALQRARWCSVDPVCGELGEQVGQGPDGCNLAACYACAITPETSCEDFNRFLDRVLVADEDVGLFAGAF